VQHLHLLLKRQVFVDGALAALHRHIRSQQLRTNRTLFPDGPVGAIEALLEERRGETIVLVGHQPSMGATAAHFLGLGSFSKPVQPGTVIGIERSDDNLSAGKLLFYAAPGQPITDVVAAASLDSEA